ncbi:MAG: GTP-binding protein [Candidatus Omnitrophica bacterium]|nr:GTP-binding protein [Candidatus Omnitrophota bacterium]MCM8798721.1 GTP-binding protein [Candidatus Omnitrophota bacterium]
MRKENLSLVITGHIDHGKSTLIGRLLLETNSLTKDRILEIKKIAQELGREAELAFLTDQLREEREKSMTIDTTQIFFKSAKRNYTIIDSPGHVEFIKNMLTGASLAEAAILIVDVTEGIRDQTRRHAFIINMLGMESLIVAVNKMDRVNFKREPFEEVKAELLKFLEALKMKADFIIPISAREGANITKKDRRLNWYKGPTLLAGLNSFRPLLPSPRKPLRFPIQDIYEIKGEKMVVGRLLSGRLKEGEEVMLYPSLEEVRVNSLKIFERNLKKAYAGENVAIILDRPFLAKRGLVMAKKENPPQVCSNFKANLFWLSEEPLAVKQFFTFRCATQEVNCQIKKIEKRIDSSTLEIIAENCPTLKLNETGIVVIETEKPVVIEKFHFIEELGRFVLEENQELKGAGIIT